MPPKIGDLIAELKKAGRGPAGAKLGGGGDAV